MPRYTDLLIRDTVSFRPFTATYSPSWRKRTRVDFTWSAPNWRLVANTFTCGIPAALNAYCYCRWVVAYARAGTGTAYSIHLNPLSRKKKTLVAGRLVVTAQHVFEFPWPCKKAAPRPSLPATLPVAPFLGKMLMQKVMAAFSSDSELFDFNFPIANWNRLSNAALDSLLNTLPGWGYSRRLRVRF